MLTIVVITLAIAGMCISVYFTLLAARLISPSAKYVPAICRLPDEACRLIVHTPAARVVGGISNSVWGIAYYAAVAAAAAINVLWQRPFAFAFAALSALTVAMGVYLLRELYVILRVRCTLCVTAHAINAALFVIFATRALGMAIWAFT